MSPRLAVSTHQAPVAGILLALVAGLLVGPVGPASAHDELISTEPSADAVLDAPPVVLALSFSADVLAASPAFVPTVVLTGPTGEIPLEAPSVDATRVSVAVPEDLVAGEYQVVWRVVSADGHPVSGSFAFSVTAAVVTPGPTSAAPTPTPTPTPTPVAPAASPSPAQSPPSLPGATPSGAALRTVGIVAGILALTAAVGLVLARRRR